jgi:RNA polymerase sigma factor (TIGR02999 family)
VSDVTEILAQWKAGEPVATEQILPLVYDELRRLAAAQLACEKPGNTLQPTALVHEAYLRLVGDCRDGSNARRSEWDNRGHFFAAAAEAMRRILVERARQKARVKHGGGLVRRGLDEDCLAIEEHFEELLALDEALTKLGKKNAAASRLVQLRYFAGLTMDEAAATMGVSSRTAYTLWSYARSWLRLEMQS